MLSYTSCNHSLITCIDRFIRSSLFLIYSGVSQLIVLHVVNCVLARFNMNPSWSPPHSPIPESSVLELTPSALRLLPKDLLVSPQTTEWPSRETVSKPVCSGAQSIFSSAANNTLRGLQLTTQSGLTLTIQDPYTAEQLVLNPLRANLLSILRAWNANPQQVDLAELIQARNMMSRAFEEHVNIFGCVSGHPATTSSVFYLDYICELVDDVTERNYLMNTLQLAQEQFWEQSNFRVHVAPSSSVTDTSHVNTDLLDVTRASVSKTCVIPETGTNIVVNFMNSQSVGNPIRKEANIRAVETTEQKAFNVAEETGLDKRDGNNVMIKQTNVQKRYKPPKLHEAAFNIRYKTQSCRHFEKSGGCCPAGENCHFAHGLNELRNPHAHPKFRTKPCRNYTETGSCVFGDHCFFLHIDRPSDSSTKPIKTDQGADCDSPEFVQTLCG